MRAHGCAALCFMVMLPTVFGSHAGNYEIMDHAVRCVRVVALPRILWQCRQLCNYAVLFLSFGDC